MRRLAAAAALTAAALAVPTTQPANAVPPRCSAELDYVVTHYGMTAWSVYTILCGV